MLSLNSDMKVLFMSKFLKDDMFECEELATIEGLKTGYSTVIAAYDDIVEDIFKVTFVCLNNCLQVFCESFDDYFLIVEQQINYIDFIINMFKNDMNFYECCGYYTNQIIQKAIIKRENM